MGRRGRVEVVLVTWSVVVVLDMRWSRSLLVLLLCAVVLVVLAAVQSHAVVVAAVLSVLVVCSRTRGGTRGGSRSAVLVVVVDRESCWTPKKTKVAPKLLTRRPAALQVVAGSERRPRASVRSCRMV